MRICIVGAGASGLLFAIKIKQSYPEYDVFCLERNEKPGKKILATGNGRCNIGNEQAISRHTYRNMERIKAILEGYGFSKEKEYLESLGIRLKLIDGLCYPVSESAKTVAEILTRQALASGINFHLGILFEDYERKGKDFAIRTSKGNFHADKIVFACGGKSSPQLGTNGSLFPVLRNHGYIINETLPGLCPIKTREDTKAISGIRVKCQVSLYIDAEMGYQESGEVLFKDDGLSGIVIFNISSIIGRLGRDHDYRISLNLLPGKSILSLKDEFRRPGSDSFCFLHGYFHEKLVNYILKRTGLAEKCSYDPEELDDLADFCTDMPFGFRDFYGFDSSQVTVGGVSFGNIDQRLQSRLENNIYFIGEILDVDGLCGGYNLMWAFGSALFLADNL